MSIEIIRNFFTHNLGLKIASVFVALCIWFWVNVTSLRTITCTVERPVGYFNKMPGIEVRTPIQSVKITVRGRRIELMANLDKIRAFVDLSKAGPRLGPVTLPVENFVPGKLEFQGMSPQMVKVDIGHVKAKPKPTLAAAKRVDSASVKAAIPLTGTTAQP